MAATEKEVAALREAVGQKQADVDRQKEVVKSLKSSKADSKEINDAVELLKSLNLELEGRTKEFSSKYAEVNGKGKSQEKQSFRQIVNETLKSKLFFIPAFGIYGGVAGLYDYGPPGCAVKANVLSLWRQHYVLEEGMLEVDCPCVTPEIVFKASGHVDKFTDLMVKDQKTGDSFRADHLLKGYAEDTLEKDPLMSDAKRQELKEVLSTLDDYSAEELGAKLKHYGITAPETKNPLSDPFPFNLMFGTQIGPAGNNQGYLRPETAQGIFVNFKDLYHYNGDKLPFAAAQIGQAFRNEISPRQGLLRVREFTLAEIEHFVDPDDKTHPKFKDVADLEFLLYPRHEQTNMKQPLKTSIGTAVEKGIVNNETLGYFIARTYLFLTKLGIDKNRLRFRQHLQNEMAHYAADCWDAEIECSFGWIEVTGLADRSAYDLKAHQDKSKVDLTAFERYPSPKMVEELKIQVKRQLLGPAFKKDAKIIAEALESMGEDEALGMKEKLESEGKAPLLICSTGQTFTITKDQVSISKAAEKRSGKKFVPGVIEPSFGIGRIIYCLYEHCFYRRPSKLGDEQFAVFRFPPIVAPIKCTVFSLRQDPDLNAVSREVHISLTRAGVANKMDLTGTSIGKRYARTDELGVPFAVTVDYDFKQTVTLRERDSRAQVRVPVSEISVVVSDVADGKLTWADLTSKYPAVTTSTDED